MSARPSPKKPPIDEAPNGSAEDLEFEEIAGVEEIHHLLLQTCVFTSVADELDHDKRWSDRVTVLIRAANRSADDALKKIESVVQDIYRHRKYQSKKSR